METDITLENLKLSPIEQKKYFELAKQGDSYSASKLFAAGMNVVKSYVNSNFGNYNFPKEDMYAQGNYALVLAFDRYDPNSNASFFTYAMNLVRDKVQQLVESESGMIHIPANVQEKQHKVYNAYEAIRHLNEGREPTTEEINDYLGTDYDDGEIYFLLNEVPYFVASSDANIGCDYDGSFTYSDIVGKDDSEYIDYDFAKDIVFNKLFDDLDDDEITVLCALNDGAFHVPSKSIGELSRELGISPYKVKQIYDSAIKTVREKAISNGYGIRDFQA